MGIDEGTPSICTYVSCSELSAYIAILYTVYLLYEMHTLDDLRVRELCNRSMDEQLRTCAYNLVCLVSQGQDQCL